MLLPLPPEARRASSTNQLYRTCIRFCGRMMDHRRQSKVHAPPWAGADMASTHPRVGIMSAGDMGSGFGAVLHAHGVEVYTCLAGRSDFTRQRAQEAGVIDTPDLDRLVSSVDL